MNSGAVRRKFAHVFTRESPTGDPDGVAAPSLILTGSSTRATAGSGMGSMGHMSRRRGSSQERGVTGCRRALFALHPKNADGRLFMVLQLSKVLQGEPEKVRRGRGWGLGGRGGSVRGGEREGVRGKVGVGAQ